MKTKFSRSNVRQEVSKDDIINDLKKIGVREGDHIAVALSFKSIGYVRGGPEAFIDALLETVGPNGTIMMNTYTTSGYIFDYRSTPSSTGLVPNTLRKMGDAIRSQHPHTSVTAIGKLAKYLTEGHDQNSGAFSPYSTLAKVDGKYLCIGLGNNLVSIRHEAQHLAGLFDVVPLQRIAKYRDKEGKVRIYSYNITPCVGGLPKLVPILKNRGIVKIGRIGMTYLFIARAKDLLNAMTEMLKNDPTLSLCDKVSCLWCREAERRLGLYEKIKNPKYFQKKLLVRGTIALINKFRLTSDIVPPINYVLGRILETLKV